MGVANPYSIDLHLPGMHNQKAHGNRFLRRGDKRLMIRKGGAGWLERAGDIVSSGKPKQLATQTGPSEEVQAEKHRVLYDSQLSWASELSEEEKFAVLRYTGAGYSGVNSKLRGPKNANYQLEPLSDQQQRIVGGLDSALGRATLPEEVTVYRGFSHPVIAQAFEQNVPEVLEGLRIRDNGFTPTSLRPDFADEFRRQEGRRGALAEMTLPKGTNAGYVSLQEITGLGTSASNYRDRPFGEAELLLPRGGVYEVQRAERDDDGTPLLIMTPVAVASLSDPSFTEKQINPFARTGKFVWREQDVQMLDPLGTFERLIEERVLSNTKT